MADDKDIIAFLSGLVTEQRLRRFDETLSERTRYISVCLEDIFQSQNASAVLRSCECLGIQDVHIIENYNPYIINPMVVKGSDRWLSLYRYNSSGNNSIEAVTQLKASGYRVVATSLQTGSTDLEAFDVSRGKTVIIFGNEHKGVSQDLLEQADECIKISMCGFTQSFNISVSAGIILYHLVQKIKKSAVDWQLTSAERNKIFAEWLTKSVKNPQPLLNRLAFDRK